MNGVDRVFFWNIWVAAAALTLFTACAGGRPGLTPRSQDHPSLRFVLAAEGLPKQGMWKCTPVFADINNDGFADMAAISRLGDGVHVWLGDGTGRWADASDGLGFSGTPCGGGVAFGDINNDGLLDLAVADHCNGVYVYLGDKECRWKAGTQELNPSVSGLELLAEQDETVEGFFMGAEDLALGDVNEDGFLDLVVAASDQGGLSVYFGDGSGKSWKEATSDGLPSAEDLEPGDEEGGGWANQVLLHDVDGDGHLDVVASYYLGPRVWLGDGKGLWKSYSKGLPSPVIGGLFRGIAVGDINEDGHLDLVVANEANGPEVYLQHPDGFWQPTPDIFPAMMGGALGIALGDLDRDGHLDLLVGGRRSKGAGSNYGLLFCQGDGKGGWTELKVNQLPATGLSVTWGIGLGDINGDGLIDFAAGTGGVCAGAPARKSATRPKIEIVPELPLPRMQVWVNRYRD